MRATSPTPAWHIFAAYLAATDSVCLERKLDDTGLAHLARLKKLNFIDLSDTRVTDVGLAHLRTLKALETASLSGTKVTYEGLLAHLKKLPKLRLLRVDDTEITDAGMNRLQRALPHCRVTF